MAKETIQIDASKLPEGMTPEKLVAIIASYESRGATGEKTRKIRSYAVDKVLKAHPGEYEAARAEAKKVLGYTED